MVQKQQAQAPAQAAQAELRIVRFWCRETSQSKICPIEDADLLGEAKIRKERQNIRAVRSVIDPKGVTVSVKGKRKERGSCLGRQQCGIDADDDVMD